LDIVYRGRTSSRSSLTPAQEAELRKVSLFRALSRLDVPPFSRLKLLWVRWRHLHTYIQDAHPFRNLHHSLVALHESGHQLFILSSNYERNVHAFLRAHKLEHLFSGVYHTQILLKSSGLKKLMKREGLDVRHAYYVANEPFDIQSAHKAGMHAIAVSWGGQDPHTLHHEHPLAVLDSPEQLLPLMAGK
jgi:phosphoglycolate phosphatase-like HAD superfamily hydrolase